MEKAKFVPTIAPLVVAENKKRGNPLFSSVVIAQAILETGYGQSILMMKANAIFGIKATLSWKGKVYNSKTKECYDGVTFSNVNASFRAYINLQDSISDYFDLITKSSRYRRACIAETPEECISEIKKGGYATDPDYVKKVMLIIKQNNLTKYDVENVENDVEKPKYEIGKNYKLLTNLNVRTGAGTKYRIKNYIELTKDGKKHAFRQIKAVLKKDTIVTCQDIYVSDKEIWIKIPSGYVCAYYYGKYYIK